MNMIMSIIIVVPLQGRDEVRIGPGIDFRKFFWKFEGSGQNTNPEISLEI